MPHARPKLHRWLGIAGALWCGFETPGCGESTSTPEPAKAELSKPAPPAVSTPAPTAEAPRAVAAPAIPSRIFVDVSTGMRGFAASRLRSAPLKSLHRMLDVTASEVSTAQAKRCSLGSMVVCVKDSDGGVRCHNTPPVTCYDKPRNVPDWSNAGLYTARSSKLDVILRPTIAPVRFDPDRPPPMDQVDEAGLTVLVTGSFVPDGVSGGAGGSSATACHAGPSPQCVASSLVERAKAGYGIWLIATQLDYAGSYVADVPVDKRYLQTVREHLQSIKSVSESSGTKFPGVTFTVGSQYAVESNAAFSQIDYTGVRPLLIFVLSRDIEQGRRFVEQLTRRMRDDVTLRPGKMAAEDIVHHVELAPLTPSAYQLQQPQLDSQQGSLGADALTEFRVGAAASDNEGVTIDVTCGAKGKGWLLVPYRRTGQGSIDPMQEALTLRGPLLERAGPPPKLGVAELVAERMAFRVFTSCSALEIRQDPWAVEYGLRRKLSFKEEQARETWWEQASAPNSYSMPERIYGLSAVARAVLELRTTDDVAMGRLKVNVRRIE